MAKNIKNDLKIPIGISIDEKSINDSISKLESKIVYAINNINKSSIDTSKDLVIKINKTVQSAVDNIENQRKSLISKISNSNISFINEENQKKVLQNVSESYLQYIKTLENQTISPFVSAKTDIDILLPKIISLADNINNVKIKDDSFVKANKSIQSLINKLQEKILITPFINVKEILPELNNITSEYLEISSNKILNLEKRIQSVSKYQKVYDISKSISDIPFISGITTMMLGPFGNLLVRKLIPLFGIDKLTSKIFKSGNKQQKELEDKLSKEIKLRDTLNKILVSSLENIEENVNIKATRNILSENPTSKENEIKGNEITNSGFINKIQSGIGNEVNLLKNTINENSIKIYSIIESSVNLLKNIINKNPTNKENEIKGNEITNSGFADKIQSGFKNGVNLLKSSGFADKIQSGFKNGVNLLKSSGFADKIQSGFKNGVNLLKNIINENPTSKENEIKGNEITNSGFADKIQSGFKNGINSLKENTLVKKMAFSLGKIHKGTLKSLNFLRTISFASMLQIAKILLMVSSIGAVAISIKKGVDLVRAIKEQNNAEKTEKESYAKTMKKMDNNIEKWEKIISSPNSTQKEKEEANKNIEYAKKTQQFLTNQQNKYYPVEHRTNISAGNGVPIQQFTPPKMALGGSILQGGNVILHKGENVIPAKISSNGALLSQLEKLSLSLSQSKLSPIENKINVNTDLSQISSSFSSLSSSLSSLSVKDETKEMINLLIQINKKLELLLFSDKTNIENKNKNTYSSPLPELVR